MTNREYVEDLLALNEKIYIDTSSLMNDTELGRFLVQYQDIFEALNKKIIVTREVCLEIVRHLSLKNIEKQEKAKSVILLFKNYSNLFIFEDKDLKQSEVSSAFADSELLSRITKDKSKHSQLLITNDKNLSVDAYKLTKLYSCKGKKIMVCFIDNLGQLNKGKTGFETNLNTLVIEQKTPEDQVEEQNNNQEESKIFQKIILGGCLLSVGFVIGRISNKLT
jgi:predicted nucleic-acid-binding protein